MHTSSEPEIEKPPEGNNNVSISDGVTQSSNEHSPSDNENDNDDVHEDAQPDNDKEPNNDVEIEPVVDLDNPQPKNKRYDKRDFVARKHGKERELWVQKPMPFPPKPSMKRMRKNLNALLTCLGQSFCVLV